MAAGDLTDDDLKIDALRRRAEKAEAEVERLKLVLASTQTCTVCGASYFAHAISDDFPDLHQLCDGSLVKL